MNKHLSCLLIFFSCSACATIDKTSEALLEQCVGSMSNEEILSQKWEMPLNIPAKADHYSGLIEDLNENNLIRFNGDRLSWLVSNKGNLILCQDIINIVYCSNNSWYIDHSEQKATHIASLSCLVH